MIPFAGSDPMSAEDNALALRHAVEVFDENRTLLLKRLEHEAVMDDLMTHIERCAVFAQGTAHRFDCAIHAGAKAARLSQDNFFDRGIVRKHAVDLVAGCWRLGPVTA